MATDRPSPAGGRRIRIGCGAGFANDRFEPAIALARDGALDYLFFEGLAERTLAQGHQQRLVDPEAGFNPTLVRRITDVIADCRRHGTRILTNMGAANPAGAAYAVAQALKQAGHHGLRIAVVTGDDVTALLRPDLICLEDGLPLSAQAGRLIRANAYLGSEPMVAALDAGADIVITGRCADPALVLAPLMHGFGWTAQDWDRLGAGTLVGHLLECSAHLTGGMFMDPYGKAVPDPAFLGYPLAEVAADGTATVTKLAGTGGMVTRETVLEQLLYEVHDPAAYLTPDVTADFSGVRLASDGPDRIALSGATGRTRPAQLKVTVGFEAGFNAEAEISYAGQGALARAQLAADILRARMVRLHGLSVPLRIDLIGWSSLHATAGITGTDPAAVSDVRLRAALRSPDRALAAALLHEMDTLWIAGPAGGAGVRGRISDAVLTRSVLLPRDGIRPMVEMVVT